MAHSLSAKKRVRQTAKQRARNRARKADVRSQVKAFASALSTGDAGKADQAYRSASKTLSQVAAKGTIHRNAAARKRSRMARKLNAIRQAGAGTAAAKA